MKPSKPFSNGSEYIWWKEQFCKRCNKYKVDKYGMPLMDNCEIEEAASESYIDLSKWPEDKIVATSEYNRLCTEFESDNLILMESYESLFEGESDGQVSILQR